VENHKVDCNGNNSKKLFARGGGLSVWRPWVLPNIKRVIKHDV